MKRAVLVLVLAGCGPGAPPPPAPAPTPSPAPTPGPTGFGTITGVVRVKGGDVAPMTKKVAGQEAHCGTEPIDLGVWRVDAATRGLRDAHVAVDAVKGTFPTAKVPTLDNGKCVFVPPVLLMQPGDLRIANSDSVPHSAHLNGVINPSENVLLPAGASRVTAVRIAERIEVTCTVHPWMHAVVIVMRSPFEALSDEGGRFEIREVPAGRRKVRVWHRCVGEVEVDVEVKAGESVAIEVEVEPKAEFRSRFR